MSAVADSLLEQASIEIARLAQGNPRLTRMMAALRGELKPEEVEDYVNEEPPPLVDIYYLDVKASGPRIRHELRIQRGNPQAKPVVEMTPTDFNDLQDSGYQNPRVRWHIYRDAVYAVDECVEGTRDDLRWDLVRGEYGHLLGYGTARTPAEGEVDVGIDIDGIILLDPKVIVQTNLEGKLIFGARLKRDEISSIHEKVMDGWRKGKE